MPDGAQVVDPVAVQKLVSPFMSYYQSHLR